jgi:hypothetical protein
MRREREGIRSMREINWKSCREGDNDDDQINIILFIIAP